MTPWKVSNYKKYWQKVVLDSKKLDSKKCVFLRTDLLNLYRSIICITRHTVKYAEISLDSKSYDFKSQDLAKAIIFSCGQAQNKVNGGNLSPMLKRLIYLLYNCDNLKKNRIKRLFEKKTTNS